MVLCSGKTLPLITNHGTREMMLDDGRKRGETEQSGVGIFIIAWGHIM